MTKSMKWMKRNRTVNDLSSQENSESRDSIYFSVVTSESAP